MQTRHHVRSFIAPHRFSLLFVTLLIFLLLVPIIHQLRAALHITTPPVLEEIVFITVLAVAAVSASGGRTRMLIALALGIPAASLGLLDIFFDALALGVVRHVFGVAFLLYVVAVMFVAIFRNQRITFNTVSASLCIYLLLGFVWALVYSLIYLLDPAAFQSTVPGTNPMPEMQIGKASPTKALYFSYATLSTLGYGDIVPVSPIARMLACIEALTGQLYLAVLVARLVGLQIAHSMSGTSKEMEETHAGGPEQ